MHGFGVSVVVPIRDEEKTILALLERLNAQTRCPDEVVLVDGGSTDRTLMMVEKFVSSRCPIRVIGVQQAYPGEGRNRGIEAARRDVIALTDAGVRPEPEWLERLCEPLERDPGIAVVYGTYEPITDSFFKECAALAYVPARLSSAKGHIRGPSIASTLIRKEVWAAVGGFPPYRASEDLIFIERLDLGGFKTAYAPFARCYWELAPGWRATFRRFAVYSYHNLVAGRGKYWHRGVMRQYVIAVPFVILAVVNHYLWFVVPLAGLAVRVSRRMWWKRNEFEMKAPLHPLRWVTVGLMLCVIDIATWAGAVAWVWRGVISGVGSLRTGRVKAPRSKLGGLGRSGRC